MHSSDQEVPADNENIPAVQEAPNCLAISERGIKTDRDFAQFMSAVMGDVIAGRLSTTKATTATRAGAALLKVIEMRHRYGSGDDGAKSLRLID